MKTENTQYFESEPIEKSSKLYWLFTVVILIWFVSIVVIYFCFNDWVNRGTFGDSFGAINSLFSGLAFAGIIYTIILQRQELALQRIELKETRKELARAAEAQEKSEKTLLKQVQSTNNASILSAMNTIVMYHTETMSIDQFGWDDRMAARSNAKEYVDKIRKIVKKIEEESS